MRNDTDNEERFERDWRIWLDRPVRRSPQAAAARVSEIVRSRRAQRRPAWVFATAAVAFAVLAGSVIFLPRTVPTETPVGISDPGAVSEPAQPGEVLIWLDEEAPLYMNFQPPALQGGSKS
jgi:hypothetical protein